MPKDRITITYFKDAIRKNREAKRQFKRLACVSGDWSTITVYECQYDVVEDNLTNFARYQLGIPLPDLKRAIREVEKELMPPKRNKT